MKKKKKQDSLATLSSTELLEDTRKIKLNQLKDIKLEYKTSI